MSLNLNQPLLFLNIYLIFKLYKYIYICIISAQKLNVFKCSLYLFFLFFLGRETSMCGCPSHTLYWGLGPQHRHVSWLGIEPVTIWFTSLCSVHWPTPGRAKCSLYMTLLSPGWCSSVGWTQACEEKGCKFDSQSGHMPGLWARSPVGGHMRGNHTLMFLPLSFSFPSLLSKNK